MNYGSDWRDNRSGHLSELVQGLKPGSLAHVPMQLSSRRQASQTKQDLGSVRSLLGPEEDYGFASSERAAAKGDQHRLLIPNAGTLQPYPWCKSD